MRGTQASEIWRRSLRDRRVATELAQMQADPVLFVDIDGVISLWGFDSNSLPPGTFQLVDGVLHFLSAGAGNHLLALSERFELVWASGWEEKANDHLPRALHLPGALPFLSFDRKSRPRPRPLEARRDRRLRRAPAPGRVDRRRPRRRPPRLGGTPPRADAARRHGAGDRAHERPRRAAAGLGGRVRGGVSMTPGGRPLALADGPAAGRW